MDGGRRKTFQKYAWRVVAVVGSGVLVFAIVGALTKQEPAVGWWQLGFVAVVIVTCALMAMGDDRD